jgi:C4-type Zn-finger protein
MTDINVLSTERLRALITDTEGTLKQLSAELEMRVFLEQENEIEKLEEHMKMAELSLDSIRQFLSLIINDLKGKE